MTCEEPEFVTGIHDFVTLFYMILRPQVLSKWFQSSIKSDLQCRLDLPQVDLISRATRSQGCARATKPRIFGKDF